MLHTLIALATAKAKLVAVAAVVLTAGTAGGLYTVAVVGPSQATVTTVAADAGC